MKLTKQIKAELAKAYQCAMEISILNMEAPLRYINQYIAENVSGYGTAADEKVQSREDYRKMLMKSRQQSKGMLFKAKIITPYKPKFTDATTAIFHDEIVVQIGDKKNMHRIHLNMSCVFKYQFNKWQMVLFHGSMPDAASSTEDTFHIGEAEKKMKELEQVVAQRTEELLTKTRELEIEASLERVRAVTMGMNKPGDILNICKVFFNELQSLGFKDLRNTLINFWDDENGQLHDYDYSDFAGGNFAKLAYSSHPAFAAFQKKIRKAKDAFAKLVIKKDGLKSWQQRRRSSGEYKDPRLNKIAVLYYYFYSTGVGALGISTFSPISKEEVEVLKKFRNVFDMAYQRYVDIQKSAAQSREAQIELALERVRASTMAMQHSEELSETVAVLFEQFKALGEEPERMAIEIVNEKENIFEIWATQHGGPQLNLLVKLSLDEPHVMQKMYKAWKAKTKSITIDLQGNELEEYFKYLKKEGLPVQRKIFGKRRVQNVATFSKGILTIITPEPRPAETIQLLERFASVFEQTYTRFLDLQKAEAQAKEAQIELALERVRARAMAMQKSDELSELVDTVFKELTKLDFALNWCIINIIDAPSLTNMVWAANPETNMPPESYLMKFEDFPFHHSMMKGYQERKTKHVYVLEGKEKKTYDDYLFNKTEWKRVPKAAQAASRAMKRYVATFTFSNFGGLQTVGEEYLSEENLDILSRFGKVFDLTYTRFNDLQKAEAQAREAQVEAALERVRSRSLAMHKSDELLEAGEILFVEMQKLGIESLTAGYVLMDKEEKNGLNYTPNPSTKKIMPLPIIIPHNETIHMQQVVENWKKGSPFFIAEMDEDETIKHQTFIAERSTNFPLNAAQLIAISPARLFLHNFYFKEGYILIVGGTKLSAEQTDIMLRFAKVFQQTYTRFLDLQKAEAQTREGQIQLALERVRARTMAMQHSNELPDAATILFQQVQSLGMPAWSAGYCTWNEDKSAVTLWMSSEGVLQPPFIAPTTEDELFIQMRKGQEEGKTFHVVEMGGDKLVKHYQYMRTLPLMGEILDSIVEAGHPLPIFQIMHHAYFSKGFLLFITYEPVPDAHDIFKRFGKVFDQTYTRFLDLQKAEAQAKEAAIELGLERVRARAMAMHKSDELAELVDTVFQELTKLGFALDRFLIMLFDDATSSSVWWVSNAPAGLFVEYHQHKPYKEYIKNWKARTPGWQYLLAGEEKKEWDNYIFENTELSLLPEVVKNGMRLVQQVYLNAAFHSFGSLTFSTFEPLSDNELAILLRFTKVFNQTYTRFLDLQKAETQAKEAQIETALERVRSRSMGMQKSEELKEVIKIVYQQLRHLNIHLDHAGFVVDYTPGGDWHFWIADEQDIPSKITHPYFESVWANQFNEAKEKEADFFATHLSFEEKNKFYNELLSYVPGLPEASKDFYLSCPGLAASTVLLENVSLYIENFAGTPYTDEENTTLMRFGKVFQQTYTRFLDLQKAEAQAKEAKIEAALERTRTQSMIMQHSNELDDTLRVFHEQVLLLGIHSGFSFLWLPDEDNDRHIFWAAWKENLSAGQGGGNDSTVFKSRAINYPLDSNEPATAQCLIDWKANDPVVSYHVPPAGVESYFAAWQELIAGVEQLKPEYFSDGLYYVEAFMKYGCFGVMVTTDLTEDEKKILGRFAIEFERTYTRFLDLQKAEAQAKEAQIETALEKVRSRTMAMQSSNELQETAAVLFNEFKKIGTENIYQVTIGIYNEEEGVIDFRVTSWVDDGTQDNRSFSLTMQEPTVIKPAVTAWKAGKKSLVIDLSGETLEQWLSYRNKISGITKMSTDTAGRRVITAAYYSKGHLSISTPVPVSADTLRTLERFAAVFDSTYTRFLDLEKAEAQAKEAQIETALERVRSRTLAMQKSDELAETAVVLFNQLIGLGIEPNRLYIGIVKDDGSGDMEMWATDEDGAHIGTKFLFNKNENESVKKLFDGWFEKRKSVVVDMQGEELKNYLHYLNEVLHIPFKTGLVQKRRVQSVAYFSKGFIGMASPDEQPEESIQLLERFAAVFNLTFTRFNDLKIAEAHAEQAEQDLIAIKEAKQKAEEALTELQATQKQLVQSEKMASLGELTAGIAHEIQNPLNFVNNFSEVSKELLDEMKEAIEKGNTEDAKEIMNDVIQNLEKINHHGKRADGIVKGMLQHSRSSSNTKEATNINALADEYLRLAYHGLRAKDKSFNATMKTDFDETIGNINIIPQDIGRVILNLITNAFYVVAEKKKVNIAGYEPTVSVSTKKVGDKVEIKVADNGNGIPQKILDKIFQPFFTTKPTGQGTGLGLSLSYDIVKAHSGELKVETKENEGTAFFIILPL